MSLREKLLSKTPKSETVEIEDMVFHVIGLTKSERAKTFAECRKKDGKLDTDRLEDVLLESCVRDTDGSVVCNAEEWLNMPAFITGPLVASVIRVNGMDGDDLGKGKSDTGETTS